MKKEVTFILSLISSFQLYAAIGNYNVGNKEVLKKSREIKQIGDNLTSIDTNLSKKNNKYIMLEKRKRSLEFELNQLIQTESDNKKKIINLSKKNNLVLKKIILNKLSMNTAAGLVNKKVLEDLYDKQNISALKIKSESDEINRKIASTRQTLYEYDDVQKEIVQILSNLEDKRQDLSQQFAQAEKEEKSLLQKIKDKLLSTTSKFILPIEKSKISKKSSESLMFKAGINDVIRSPKDGVVAYVGSLSIFGNVVIVNHDDKYDSVIYGDLKNRVTTGQKVKQGDVLAHVEGKNDGTIEFDIRKNSVSQKIDSFFDNKFIASK